MLQAGMTLNDYLIQAIEKIDRHLGEGYAKDHPQLLAAAVTMQAADFHTTALSAALFRIERVLDDNLDKCYAALADLEPAILATVS